MGVIFLTFIGFAAGLLFVGGWASVDAICACIPIVERAALGFIGLFTIAGLIVGAVATAFWS